MDALATSLLPGLLEDRPSGAVAADAVRDHLVHRRSWYASFTGPLVIPDTALARYGRETGEESLAVKAVASGGAGGLSALAGREVPGLRLVAAESAVRDLDDPAGSAARVVAAAGEL